MMTKSIVFTANRGYAIYSSRRELVDFFLSNGWRVFIVTKRDDYSEMLVAMGVVAIYLTTNRSGFSLISDLSLFVKMISIFSSIRPSLIHNFHSKFVILGSITARISLGRSVRIVNTITGLGHIFIRPTRLYHIVLLSYRFSLSKSDLVIFQNPHDRNLFIYNRLVRSVRHKLIIGSGINLDEFPFIQRGTDGENNQVNVVMIGRLLYQKGFDELIFVANSIVEKYPMAKFFWAGEFDTDHPDAVPMAYVNQQKNVIFLGNVSNIIELLKKSDILLFPSYREGVPRAVMEAASTGIPTICFDVPGLREVVIDGVTGYLVPFGDSNQLLKRTEELIKFSDVRLRMGINASALAHDRFSRSNVIAKYIEAYSDIGVKF